MIQNALEIQVLLNYVSTELASILCFFLSPPMLLGQHKALKRDIEIANFDTPPVLAVYFLKMGECREVLGGGPAPP